METLNANKDDKQVNQHNPEILSQSSAKLKQSVATTDALMAEGNIDDRSDFDINKDGQEDFAMVSQIHLEIGGRHNLLKKKPRKWDKTNVTKFHYRQSAYDIGLAVSVTDEIINLEPLEDKVNLLR